MMDEISVVLRRNARVRRTAAVAVVRVAVTLALVAATGVAGMVVAGCASDGDENTGGELSPPGGFTAFTDGTVRLAHPPGYVAAPPEPRGEGTRTVLTGPELSPGSLPRIVVGIDPPGVSDAEAADIALDFVEAEGGRLVSRGEVDVPGATRKAVMLEIVDSERLEDGTYLDTRSIQLFLTTRQEAGVLVSVASLDRDFAASRLREVIPTVTVVP